MAETGVNADSHMLAVLFALYVVQNILLPTSTIKKSNLYTYAVYSY